MSEADYERLMLERRCVHCDAEATGGLYTGRAYLLALLRHRGEEAVRLARKVEPFFWGDADIVRMRLCGACADELALGEPPQDESADDAAHSSEQAHAHARRSRRGAVARQRGGGGRKMRVSLLHLPLALAVAAAQTFA